MKKAWEKAGSIAASPVVTGGVWVVVLVLVAYLSYVKVWQTLTKPFTLPPGVVPTQLSLDPALLQQINQQREVRGRYVAPTWRIKNVLP